MSRRLSPKQLAERRKSIHSALRDDVSAMKSGREIETPATPPKRTPPPRRFKPRMPAGYMTVEDTRAETRRRVDRALNIPAQEEPTPVELGVSKPPYYVER